MRVRIEIRELKIWNFKSIVFQQIDFNNYKTQIFGASDTGKSTIIDAYTWLLWGRDREGRKEQNIKRISTTTFEEIKNINHKVEGVFIIDGERFVLTKSLVERFYDESTIIGHKIVYTINNREVTQKEYSKFLKNLCSDEIFFISTTPNYFYSLNQERKCEILYSLYPKINICGDNRYKALERRMKNLSIYEYRRELMNQKRVIKDKIESIGERIKERTYIQNIYSQILQPELVIDTPINDEDHELWFSKISNHISDYIRFISYKSITAISSERVYDLIESNNGLSGALNELDKELELLREYINDYLGELEQHINDLFNLVHFSLLKRDSKKESEDICDITIRGISYNSLSRDARLAADFDLIATFSLCFGIEAPVFIDNAETISSIPHIDNQLITLNLGEENILTVKQ